MRKQDYATLARIIRHALGVAPGPDTGDRLYRAAAESIARQFAELASVDQVEFLKACGLDP